MFFFVPDMFFVRAGSNFTTREYVGVVRSVLCNIAGLSYARVAILLLARVCEYAVQCG